MSAYGAPPCGSRLVHGHVVVASGCSYGSPPISRPILPNEPAGSPSRVAEVAGEEGRAWRAEPLAVGSSDQETTTSRRADRTTPPARTSPGPARPGPGARGYRPRGPQRRASSPGALTFGSWGHHTRGLRPSRQSGQPPRGRRQGPKVGIILFVYGDPASGSDLPRNSPAVPACTSGLDHAEVEECRHDVHQREGGVPSADRCANTATLATKPTVGGMPARESRNSVMSPARSGLRLESPAYAVSDLPLPLAETSTTTPNAPSLSGVPDQVATSPRGCQFGSHDVSPAEDEAGVGDAGVRQHPLDVGLRDRPKTSSPGSPTRPPGPRLAVSNPTKAAGTRRPGLGLMLPTRATLVAADTNAVTGVGRPLVHVRRPRNNVPTP